MDFAFSYSSIEHNGLGRYGDPVNPNADLQDVEMLSCIIRPGGARSQCLPCCLMRAGSPYHLLHAPHAHKLCSSSPALQVPRTGEQCMADNTGIRLIQHHSTPAAYDCCQHWHAGMQALMLPSQSPLIG